MEEWKLALLISAAGYGLTILVLLVVSFSVWAVRWLVQKAAQKPC
jgi:hypothetical protein